MVEQLATLLEAGVAPESAWSYLGEFSTHPVVSVVSRAIASGSRVTDALAGAVAPFRSTTAWRALGTAWAVADEAGSPLAPSLRELGAVLRDRAETEREIEVGLAGPLATSRLVGWLPVLGLALGGALGVDMVGTLLGGVIGWVVLASGCALLIGGRLWTRSLARRAAPPVGAPGFAFDLVAVALTGGVSVPLAKGCVRDASARFDLALRAEKDLDRILALAERAGAPAADLLRSAARQARRDARIDGKRAAATLAVRLMLPLGVCVLPSFLLLGVAPVVLSIVSSTVSRL
ncbi:type II secretion system F family protein [Leifsonia poae]|uniref:type II secretion system F family protein n=1 Tax=Leifsonia poae TaxID=110933 RepID=UPI001CC15EDA|nr:type II secretion system F family protein [Leifsonia poae]